MDLSLAVGQVVKEIRYVWNHVTATNTFIQETKDQLRGLDFSDNYLDQNFDTVRQALDYIYEPSTQVPQEQHDHLLQDLLARKIINLEEEQGQQNPDLLVATTTTDKEKEEVTNGIKIANQTVIYVYQQLNQLQDDFSCAYSILSKYENNWKFKALVGSETDKLVKYMSEVLDFVIQNCFSVSLIL
jgi:hypothetical protein